MFAALGKLGSDFIKKLVETKIIVNKGVTIYHKSSEIEFALMLSLGPEHSRVTSILNKLSNVLNKSIAFDNVIEVSGLGMPHLENLVDMGTIKIENNATIIDFAKIIREVKSETVFLKIRKKIPHDLRQLLVVNRLNRTSRYIGKEFVETDIEVALDYADLWYKVLDQYTVRDIEFDFNLEVSIQTIVEKIPKNLRDKILRSVKSTKQNNDAVAFLSAITEAFVSFESDQFLQKLVESVIVEPSDSFSIVSVTPKMQKLEIASVGYPVVVPGLLRIRIECRLEGKEIAKTGKLRIDLQKFGNVISELVAILQQKTNKLKIP